MLANVGNVIQAIYVYSLPAGPIWFLHGFYLAASALMLSLHLRHIDPDPGAPPARRLLSSLRPRPKSIIEGGRHDGDND